MNPFRRFSRPRIPEGPGARRLLWVGAGAVVFYLLMLSDFGLLQRWRLAGRIERTESRIEELREQEAALQAARERTDDDDALERAAREQHGMIRPGEHVYRLAEPDTSR